MGGLYLSHHGILGQKWGVRRYQNEDGSLTPEGQQRYGTASKKELKQAKKMLVRSGESAELVSKAMFSVIGKPKNDDIITKAYMGQLYVSGELKVNTKRGSLDVYTLDIADPIMRVYVDKGMNIRDAEFTDDVFKQRYDQFEEALTDYNKRVLSELGGN